MGNKKISVVVAVFFLALGTALSGGVLAADEPSAAEPGGEETAVEVPEEVQRAIEEAAEQSLAEEQKPQEVKTDTDIEAEDLDVREAKILPGSFFYGFKNFFRGVQEIVARDPVKKAEIQLRHANEKIVEAKQLVEKDDSEKAAEIAAGVIEGINRNFEQIANQSENLKKAKVRDGQRVEKFLDKIADQSLKQQVVLQKLQERVSEKVFVKIEQSRQDHLERFGQVMMKVGENPEELAQRLPQIVENREGSDFKELKAVEILRDLEDKVPQEAKEALRAAQTALSQRFEQRFSAIPPEERKERLQNYVESLPGNAVRQFEAFDRMKDSFQSEGMIKEMELAKDKALRKFENQFSQFQGEEARQAFMQPWREGSPEALRTMTEMEMRLDPAEDEGSRPVFQGFQQFRQEAQDNFKERFGDNPEVLKQNQVFQRMKERPDIVDLKMSQDLMEVFAQTDGQPTNSFPGEPGAKGIDAQDRPVEPISRVFREFKERATEKFIDNMEQGIGFTPEPGQLGQPTDRPPTPRYIFGPPVPGGLRVLEEIRDQVSPQGREGLNRAIEAQTQTMERHLEGINDPAMLERYKQQIEGDQAVKTQVERFGPNIFRKIEQQDQKMKAIEREDQERKLQRMEEINQQIFEDPQGESRQREGVLQKMKPEMRQEVERFRQNVPSGQQPIFRPQVKPQPQENNSGQADAPQRPNVPLTPERQRLFEQKAGESSTNFQQIQTRPEFQVPPQPQPAPAPVSQPPL